jgi:hypothetical protein
MSWWVQTDRQTFSQRAAEKLPEMSRTKDGQRSWKDYSASYARSWGPMAAEHKMRQWKERQGEAA